MKKLCLILSFLMLFPMTLTACNSNGTKDADASKETTTAKNETTASAPDADQTTEPTTAATTEPLTPPVTPPTTPKSLKILALGNSFSTDAMEYLYDIAKSAGFETVVLGNMYIGSCTLDMHWQHASDNDKAYTYLKNTTGKWVSNANTDLETALKDEEWDFITFQQSSKNSGILSSYDSLKKLISIVKSKVTNPDAKMIWHMTWAYQHDCKQSAFSNYNHDQMTMYEMTVEAVQRRVLNFQSVDGVIPNGTSIQNARTSFVGDRLTRDGYHLDYTLGRYIAALTYFAAVTGLDISNVTYAPTPDITPAVLEMAKSAVMDAIKTPFEVTPSTHTTGTWIPADKLATTPVLPSDCFELDKLLAASIGIDLSKYEILVYEYEENAYYVCTNGSKITYPKESVSTYHQNICTKKIYSIEEIPVNSIIICDAGWQYRPELWVSLDQKATSRYNITSAQITLLDAEWWGNSQYFALNVSSKPKTDISEYYDAAASHVRIYVLKDQA